MKPDSTLNRSSLHVTHVIPTPSDGGVRRYVQQVCAMQGVTSTVISVFASTDVPEMELNAAREIRLDIPLQRVSQVSEVVREVASAIRTVPVGILHSHHLATDLLCSATSATPGPMLRHVHGILQRSSDDPCAPKGVRFDWTPAEIAQEREVQPKFSATICPSVDLQRKLVRYGLSDKGTIHLPNAVEVAHFHPADVETRKEARRSFGLKEDAYVVGFLGRLEPCKNPGFLLELAAQAIRSVRPQFLVMGSGPLEQSLASEIAHRGLKSRFHLHHSSGQVVAFYAAIDVLVIPSLTEGHPFTLLEAMSSGLPVIAFAVGGIQETIDQGTDGFLASPGDIVTVLAAIERLALPEEREAIGKRARDRIERDFGLASHRTRLLRIYEQVRHAANA